MKLLAALPILALGTLALAADPYEGTWKLTGTSVPKGVDARAIMRSGRVTFSLKGKQSGQPMTMTATGRYVGRPSSLTLTFSDATVASPSFTKAQKAQMNTPAFRQRMKQGVSRQNTTGPVKFEGKNRFVLTEKNGKKTVFTRVR